MAWAEHPQHVHIAGGLVAAGVEMDFMERPITTFTWQLSHARMLADRGKAGMLAQFVD